MNKVQIAVENFEIQFENLVQEYLGDISLNKAIEYFRSDNLSEAVCDVFANIQCDLEDKENEDLVEIDEDGETE